MEAEMNRVPEEMEVLEEENETSPAPMIYGVSSYGADYTIEVVVSRMRSGLFCAPDLQRNYVWTRSQASRLIESLLLGLPIPGVFLAKDTEKPKHLIIDGQQRMKSLQYFFDEKFGANGKFNLSGVQERWQGKTWSTLTEPDRQRLSDSIIHATIIKQDSPKEDNTSIYHVYERLNTGGISLTPHEIRTCVYSDSDVLKLSRKCNKDENWRGLFGRKHDKRMKDEELILRFYALSEGWEDYREPMKEFINKYCLKHRSLDDAERERLDRAFRNAIRLVYEGIGNRAFRPAKERKYFNAAVFDAIMVGIFLSLKDNLSFEPPERLGDAYEKLFEDQAFIDSYRSTAKREKLIDRITLAAEAFRKVAN